MAAAESAGGGSAQGRAGHTAGSSSGIAMAMERTAAARQSGEGRKLWQAQLAGEMPPAVLIHAGKVPGVPARGLSRRHPLPELHDSPDGSKRVLAEREALGTPRTCNKGRVCTGQYIKYIFKASNLTTARL